MATIQVSVGQDLLAGGVVGTATSHLHFGVRDGTTYLDPELLFAAAGHADDVGVVARLVPTGGAPARASSAASARARGAAGRRLTAEAPRIRRCRPTDVQLPCPAGLPG